MTGNIKGKVTHESPDAAKMKAQKITDKENRATEKMHTNVTASLDQLQHAGVAAQAVSLDGKTGVHKGASAAKKTAHNAPVKRM